MLWNRFCVAVVSVVAHGRAITLMADRAFPCGELIAWFKCRPRWCYVMRLRGDTEIHGTAAPLDRWQPERGPGDRSSHRPAGRGALVSDQQPCSRSRSGLELREALLL